MQRRFELTLLGRLLMLLTWLTFLASWMTDSEVARVAAALLATPLLVDCLWKGGRLPPLEIGVAPRRTRAGSRFMEHVVLRNRSLRRPCNDLLLAEPDTSTPAGGACLEAVAARGEVQLSLPARLRRRGVRTSRTFTVESCFPLGVLRSAAAITCATELVVEPARVDLPVHVLDALDRLAASESSDHRHGPAEFYALREYTSGEDARSVHALKSAATGTLVRRIHRGQEVRESCLVLDLRRPPGRPAQVAGPLFEWSLGAAATIVDRTVARRGRLLCVVLGESGASWDVHSDAEAQSFLTFLARAAPSQYAAADAALLAQAHGFQACYWIPAGGHRATEERAAIDGAVLVTEWQP